MGIFDVLIAVILGIVEGITEWLPISSTGHMILVNQFMSFSDKEFQEMFLVVVQLGAILAVVLIFWNKIWPFNFRYKKNEQPFVKMDTMQMWIKILISYGPENLVDEFKASRKTLTSFIEEHKQELSQVRNTVGAHRDEDVSKQISKLEGLQIAHVIQVALDYNKIILEIAKFQNALSAIGIKRLEDAKVRKL